MSTVITLRRPILFATAALIIVLAGFAMRTNSAGAWSGSTRTSITGKAICSEYYRAVWGLTYIRDNGCNWARLDAPGYSSTVYPSKRGLTSYGNFTFGGVPVNTYATLTFGSSKDGRTCSSGVWISKPAYFESLSIGDFYCR